MPPFDRRRPVRTRTTPAVFTSDDLDRDLSDLMQDPLYWRERDTDFHDHVSRQFQRVHGPDGPAPDAAGKRRGTLEVPRLRRRPGDDRFAAPVGREAANQPGDVAKLQRALSETGDYTFTAPRERSGVMSAGLDQALTRFQTRTGLKPDGYAAPNGPTVQRIAAEADNASSLPPRPGRKPGHDLRPAGPDERRTIGASREERAEPSYEPTQPDRLLAEIGNTQLELEDLDDDISVIERDIEAERDRLRELLQQSAQDGSSSAKFALNRLERLSKKAVRKLNPIERLKDLGEIATVIHDLPHRVGEVRNIPGRIERWRTKIGELEGKRQRLERKLDKLRDTQSETSPRHVPAYDRSAE